MRPVLPPKNGNQIIDMSINRFSLAQGKGFVCIPNARQKGCHANWIDAASTVSPTPRQSSDKSEEKFTVDDEDDEGKRARYECTAIHSVCSSDLGLGFPCHLTKITLLYVRIAEFRRLRHVIKLPLLLFDHKVS